MPPEVLRSIYEETGHDFSSDICPGAMIKDLDDPVIHLPRNGLCALYKINCQLLA
jgi:hypothetical protein